MQSDAVRLDWSRWSRCESSFNLLLTPQQPGIFALAEEIVDATVSGGKRMLAVLEVAAAEDLSRTLSALFSPASALRDRLLSGNCFIRYAVVPDAMQRELIVGQLQQWISASAETATGFVQGLTANPNVEAAITEKKSKVAPAPLPAGF